MRVEASMLVKRSFSSGVILAEDVPTTSAVMSAFEQAKGPMAGVGVAFVNRVIGLLRDS